MERCHAQPSERRSDIVDTPRATLPAAAISCHTVMRVLKKPNIKLDIIEVIFSLTQYTKVQPSVAIICALSDLMRHLRKSIQYSLDNSNLGTETINWNKKFGEAVNRCLVQLSIKIYQNRSQLRG
ncbi:unnamed protein product [Vicia faba]|uniref:Uncharacterized protein n=1 Tax=Vicia faba TaxID=3906 RepID=A0AAV0YLZ1_VICFA|nr:unnamed protein product [Vicia faba]